MKNFLGVFQALICSTLLIQLHGHKAFAANWKQQELALMALTRCLVTGEHVNRKEASMFIAQIVKEQSGQYQRVYDSLYEGVDKSTFDRVTEIIKNGKGCRLMLNEFAYSEPSTPFKQDIIYDQMLNGVTYPDDN